jgi:hypothetical protein
MRSAFPCFAFLCALALISSCGTPPPPPPVESARGALMERIGPAGTIGPTYCQRDRICGSDVLPDFYRARDFRPAWTDNGLVLANASSFLDALRLVAEDGRAQFRQDIYLRDAALYRALEERASPSGW